MLRRRIRIGRNGGLQSLIRMGIDWFFVVGDGVILSSLLRLMGRLMGFSCDADE